MKICSIRAPTEYTLRNILVSLCQSWDVARRWESDYGGSFLLRDRCALILYTGKIFLEEERCYLFMLIFLGEILAVRSKIIS